MISRRKFWVVVLLVMIVQIIPFAVALSRSGEGLVFGGFVLNPLDGNSYLAKMQQGLLGEWRFRLPYTANPGEGAYLFLFYLFLGHLARIFGLSVQVMFHVARLAAGLALCFAVASFTQRLFPEKKSQAELAFVLAMVGGGMGWLALLGGYMPADVWVAEGYPYLSLFTNPHFPLGLALVLWLVQPAHGTCLERQPWIRLGLGLLLAVIQPFGIVVVGVVLGVETGWRWLEDRRLQAGALFWSMGLGGPFLLYQWIVIQSDPILAGWNAQNITLAPPLWDLVLSLSPALFFSAAGGYMLWKDRNHPGRRVLIGWLVAGFVLIYLPFSLQRRFMTGLFVPVAGLAAVGLDGLRTLSTRRWRWAVPFVVSISTLTNVLMLFVSVLGVGGKEADRLFMTSAENQALEWIRTETPRNAVFAASPDMGTFIPANTGRFVVYGHPFETVNADEEKELVERFLAGRMDVDERSIYLKERNVSFIFYGPREKLIGVPVDLQVYQPVYDAAGVAIYAIGP